MRGKNFTVIILTGLMLLELTGCGDTQMAYRTTETVTKSECSSHVGARFVTCTITMPDSRRVTCIAESDYKAYSMSCDWAHADGADKGAE